MKLGFAIYAAFITQSSAFVPVSSVHSAAISRASTQNSYFARRDPNEQFINQFDPFDVPKEEAKHFPASSLMTSMVLLSTPTLASAADTSSSSYQILSAFAAYGHYLSLFVMVGALTFERFTIEPGMSKEKEKALGVADAIYGVAGVALLVSGYFRAVSYGKGWEFYSHEPIFWLKMVFLSILGAASLFPTITIIKRTVAIQTGKELAPMTEKLAKRLKSVATAEMVMLASIPLAATLMARGVLYTDDIPFNIIGPVLVAITAGGLGYKYVKEALTWTED
jgi:putative membrane protein